ncbi:innexin shaking-B-like [Hyalella azteca]|uniref:Innexin n=1 Tax=Hyalella azteca TaxID=294128 RepID=A0A979FXJ0_HYAAZ|nr:innexin shaking-B-like [Hyalella azteca]
MDRNQRGIWNNFNRLQEAILNLSDGHARSSVLVDSWVLLLHYRITAGIYLIIFIAVTAGWYAEHPLLCVNLADRSEVKDYFKSLCFSYAYTNVSRADVREAGMEEDTRVYAAHYRWLHWVCLLLMCLYRLPLVHATSCAVPHVVSLLKNIKDTDDRKQLKKLQISHLLVDELRWNSHVFTKLISCHLLALLVDLISVLILETLLDNKFVTLITALYPFRRDSRFFSDPLSLLFPPFVTCQVGPEMMLLNYRTEVMGCRLTLMELYEKVVVALWFWKAFLITVTIFKLLHLIILACSKAYRNCLVRSCVEANDGDSTLVTARYSVGDLLILNKLRQLLDGHCYRAALHHAAYVEWSDHFDDELIPEAQPHLCCRTY